MEKVSLSIEMGTSTLETGSTLGLKVMAYLIMQMVQDMMDTGKKISKTV